MNCLHLSLYIQSSKSITTCTPHLFIVVFLQSSFFCIHAQTMVLTGIDPSHVSWRFGTQYCSKIFPERGFHQSTFTWRVSLSSFWKIYEVVFSIQIISPSSLVHDITRNIFPFSTSIIGLNIGLSLLHLGPTYTNSFVTLSKSPSIILILHAVH